MKISRPESESASGLGPSAGPGPAAERPASNQPVGGSAASDRAQLSSLSSYLISALNGSPAHLAKVSELAAAVSSGQYQVSASVISGSIIQHGIELGGSGYSAMTT